MSFNNWRDKTKEVLNNHGFFIVKFNAFSFSSDNKEENIIEYKLLVEDSGLCFDYKIHFHQISITNVTTKSHKNQYLNHKNNSKYHIRTKFLEMLELEHIFNEFRGKRKQYYFYNENHKNLSKINQYLLTKNLKTITFQNIEYILRGENAGGQGSGKGYLNLKYDNTYLPFGLFLQAINKISERNELFEDREEQISWGEIWEKSESRTIDFETFLSSNGEIKDLFLKFKNHPSNWKSIKEDFKNFLNKKCEKFLDVDKLVRKYRSEGVINFEKKYGSNKLDAIRKFFNITDSNFLPDAVDIQYAHIYPVNAIRRGYLKKEISDLKAISDADNFLPLTTEIHKLYDSNKLYWMQNGELQIFEKDLNQDYYKINFYTQISSDILSSTQITSFLKKFLNLRNIKSNNLD